MDITVTPITDRRSLKQFATFPWRVNQGDPCWVPPLINERIDKLTPGKNPFWQNAERALWIAWRGREPLGTIAAIIDRHGNQVLGRNVGQFGFFECLDDPAAARALIDTAAGWLRERGMQSMQGPSNPSPTDDNGILVEGFDTRPAIMEAHNPPYYAALVEGCGLRPVNNMVARLFCVPPGTREVDALLPDKLARVSEAVARRPDLTLRAIRMDAWESEVAMACDIYNAALGPLPGYVPVPRAEFMTFANSFKTILDARMGIVAEVDGQPVGYALALPDVNEALRYANGRLSGLGLARVWWHSRHLTRASFKILMMLPAFQGRGIEALLVREVGRAIIAAGYKEVDMSLTGDENLKSSRFQERLGMRVYRRYRIYEMGL